MSGGYQPPFDYSGASQWQYAQQQQQHQQLQQQQQHQLQPQYTPYPPPQLANSASSLNNNPNSPSLPSAQQPNNSIWPLSQPSAAPYNPYAHQGGIPVAPSNLAQNGAPLNSNQNPSQGIAVGGGQGPYMPYGAIGGGEGGVGGLYGPSSSSSDMRASPSTSSIPVGGPGGDDPNLPHGLAAFLNQGGLASRGSIAGAAVPGSLDAAMAQYAGLPGLSLPQQQQQQHYPLPLPQQQQQQQPQATSPYIPSSSSFSPALKAEASPASIPVHSASASTPLPAHLSAPNPNPNDVDASGEEDAAGSPAPAGGSAEEYNPNDAYITSLRGSSGERLGGGGQHDSDSDFHPDGNNGGGASTSQAPVINDAAPVTRGRTRGRRSVIKYEDGTSDSEELEKTETGFVVPRQPKAEQPSAAATNVPASLGMASSRDASADSSASGSAAPPGRGTKRASSTLAATALNDDSSLSGEENGDPPYARAPGAGFAAPRARRQTEIPAVEDDPSVRPYGCNYCAPTSVASSGAAFAWRTIKELREHHTGNHKERVKQMEEEAKEAAERGEEAVQQEMPFRCALDPCGKTFKSLAGLRFHFQNASANGHFFVQLERDEETGEERPTKKFKQEVKPSGRELGCPVGRCPKRFKQSAGLAYHLSHTQNHPITLSLLSTFEPTLQSKTKWWFNRLGKTFAPEEGEEEEAAGEAEQQGQEQPEAGPSATGQQQQQQQQYQQQQEMVNVSAGGQGVYIPHQQQQPLEVQQQQQQQQGIGMGLELGGAEQQYQQ